MAGTKGVQSIHECATLALLLGYAYFALQFGGECWVSNSFANASQYGRANNCNMNCPSGGGYCGGGYANALYRVGEIYVPIK